MINISNIPVEPTVTIINPDGSELITTNDITTFNYIRLEIKKNKLEGYKIRTATGCICNIKPSGKLSYWPDNEIPGVEYDKILIGLLTSFLCTL